MMNEEKAASYHSSLITPHSSFIIMKTLTLFEHEQSPEGFELTLREQAALERLNRAVGAEVLRATLRRRRVGVCATQYVGLVRLGGRAVQVLPKTHRVRHPARAGVEDEAAGGALADGARDESAREATRNLLHMLAAAGRLPVREHSLAPLVRRGGDWFEILTRLFASHLLEEWQRGAHRHYHVIEDELPVLKGRWRVAEHLRRPARRHVFPVAFDEFTADNSLNRVLRFVVERLWRLTRDSDNRRALGELRQWMEEVHLPAHVTAREAAPALLTRLNARYEPLLSLARLFLEGGSLQLAARDFTTYAFVFDMNRLFEEFVVGLVRRHRERVLPEALHDCALLPQSHKSPHYLARDEESRLVFQLRPDLAFKDGDKFPLLLDAKYKRLDAADRRLGVSQSDFYQMHAYARRYRCPRVVLLYPQTADTNAPLRARFTLEDERGVTIEAATLDLRADLSTAHGRDRMTGELKKILGGTDDST
jgi:5-methylcytosine-specific restriction enzyme subunit McrC